jgi:hypothetical protein
MSKFLPVTLHGCRALDPLPWKPALADSRPPRQRANPAKRKADPTNNPGSEGEDDKGPKSKKARNTGTGPGSKGGKPARGGSKGKKSAKGGYKGKKAAKGGSRKKSIPTAGREMGAGAVGGRYTIILQSNFDKRDSLKRENTYRWEVFCAFWLISQAECATG